MITPMDIHNKTFSRGLRGYNQEEVEAFLQELASDYERIYREHREMEEEMDTIKTKLRNYEKMESTMSSTLVMAQETAENVKRNAEKEAELSVREARNKAHQILSEAEASRVKLNADLLKCEGDMSLYIEKILANFKTAIGLIEALKNAPKPQVIEATTEETKEKEEPIDDRSADLFEEQKNNVETSAEKEELSEEEKSSESKE